MEDDRGTMGVKKVEENRASSSKELAKKLITLKVAAGMTGIPGRTLREMCQRREVEHVRIGSRYYFRPAQIEKMIERRTVNVRAGDDRYRRRR